MDLQKAKITPLDQNSDQGKSFDVQFNPSSLRLTLTNKATGGRTHSNPVRQIVGASESTLAVDLIFDTADEGTGANPVSVRKRTKQLELFLFPRNDQEHAPPRIRFEWGDMIMIGIVDSLTVDFDHFAGDGQPLRAKVSLSIKGQDRLLALQSVAPGARQGAPPPGGGSPSGPGGGGGDGDGAPAPNAAKALAGESAGEMAARLGLDPAAWRGLQLGGESSLSLSAGVEIGFSAGLSASAGLGVTLGVEAGASVSLEASFGLEASAGINAVAGVGVGADLAAGFALSAAGGVSAAIESVQSAKNQAAEQQARTAFKAPPKPLPAATSTTKQLPSSTSSSVSSTGAQPKPPEQQRVPLKSTGLPSTSAQESAASAPRTPRADPRASGFGFGVPLRGTVGQAADKRAESIRGDVAIKPRIASGDPPLTSDPTTPGWIALPVRDRGRNTADKVQTRFRPKRPCGCSGGCSH
ncbi:MAG TPA: hypothetical protein VGN90_11905 [Pyrinomonadaceae bacterium]|jgi:hypothetical protein|nr:hypothetical protein [Pyrinomonadaceae bacterium]